MQVVWLLLSAFHMKFMFPNWWAYWTADDPGSRSGGWVR